MSFDLENMTDEEIEHLLRVASQRKGVRIYEYVASDGTRFFSFTKYIRTISKPMPLTLQSRIGKHLINFLTELRHMGSNIESNEDA